MIMNIIADMESRAALTTGVAVPRMLGPLTKQAFMNWLALH